MLTRTYGYKQPIQFVSDNTWVLPPFTLFITQDDLINDNTELQEKAATTDNLLSVLSEFFLNKPDEDDENTDELSVQLYNNLCKVSWHISCYI